MTVKVEWWFDSGGLCMTVVVWQWWRGGLMMYDSGGGVCRVLV